MNEQMNLLYHGKQARRTDPETSRDAADSIADVRAILRRRVEAFARSRGASGFTDYEMGTALGNHGSGLRTRRNELTKEGIIVPTDERRTLPSGRRAVVWRHRDFNQEGE